MPDKDCPFCNIPDDRIVASNDLALAIYDNFPVSPGHMLFVPRRHVASWFDATEQEQIAIMSLINEFQRSSDTPRGYKTRGHDALRACPSDTRNQGLASSAGPGEDTPRETATQVVPSSADHEENSHEASSPGECLHSPPNKQTMPKLLPLPLSSPTPTRPSGKTLNGRGLSEARQSADARQSGDDSQQSYNLGINIGPAAGQTVMHLHVHLIPRYEGDADDPRGGVRWVLPGKAKYWE